MRTTWLTRAALFGSLPLFVAACGGQVGSPDGSGTGPHADPLPITTDATPPSVGITPPSPDGGPPDAEVIISHTGPAQLVDSGTCVVVATSYSAACTTASDCVAVAPGGNTCDPCSAGSGDFECQLTALNVSSATAYNAALQAALAPLQGTSSFNECVIASCPVLLAPTCQAGTCVIPFDDAIPDAAFSPPAVDATDGDAG